LEKLPQYNQERRLLVGVRRGVPLKNPAGVPFERLEDVFPEVSSTLLRETLLLGGHSRFIAGPVNSYIQRQGLYFSRERRLLRTLLTLRGMSTAWRWHVWRRNLPADTGKIPRERPWPVFYMMPPGI